MKTTLVLYGSAEKFHGGYKNVCFGGLPPYYVRAEKSPFGLEEALAKAKPRPGETVLNTVEVERNGAKEGK